MECEENGGSPLKGCDASSVGKGSDDSKGAAGIDPYKLNPHGYDVAYVVGVGP